MKIHFRPISPPTMGQINKFQAKFPPKKSRKPIKFQRFAQSYQKRHTGQERKILKRSTKMKENRFVTFLLLILWMDFLLL
jgi:hypothetical protein